MKLTVSCIPLSEHHFDYHTPRYIYNAFPFFEENKPRLVHSVLDYCKN